NTRDVLIPGGLAEQWVERGQQPARGVRSYVQAVDFNGDGHLDILLGDFAQSMMPRENLTAREEQEMRALKAQLDELDRRSGFDQRDIRSRSHAYAREETGPANEELTDLLDRLAPYLQLYHFNKFDSLKPIASHGMVWVYLNRGRGKAASPLQPDNAPSDDPQAGEGPVRLSLALTRPPGAPQNTARLA